jgi:hypothetical protein
VKDQDDRAVAQNTSKRVKRTKRISWTGDSFLDPNLSVEDIISSSVKREADGESHAPRSPYPSSGKRPPSHNIDILGVTPRKNEDDVRDFSDSIRKDLFPGLDLDETSKVCDKSISSELPSTSNTESASEIQEAVVMDGNKVTTKESHQAGHSAQDPNELQVSDDALSPNGEKAPVDGVSGTLSSEASTSESEDVVPSSTTLSVENRGQKQNKGISSTKTNPRLARDVRLASQPHDSGIHPNRIAKPTSMVPVLSSQPDVAPPRSRGRQSVQSVPSRDNEEDVQAFRRPKEESKLGLLPEDTQRYGRAGSASSSTDCMFDFTAEDPFELEPTFQVKMFLDDLPSELNGNDVLFSFPSKYYMDRTELDTIANTCFKAPCLEATSRTNKGNIMPKYSPFTTCVNFADYLRLQNSLEDHREASDRYANDDLINFYSLFMTRNDGLQEHYLVVPTFFFVCALPKKDDSQAKKDLMKQNFGKLRKQILRGQEDKSEFPDIFKTSVIDVPVFFPGQEHFSRAFIFNIGAIHPTTKQPPKSKEAPVPCIIHVDSLGMESRVHDTQIVAAVIRRTLNLLRGEQFYTEENLRSLRIECKSLLSSNSPSSSNSPNSVRIVCYIHSNSMEILNLLVEYIYRGHTLSPNTHVICLQCANMCERIPELICRSTSLFDKLSTAHI